MSKKIDIPIDLYKEIIRLVELGYGSRKIAKSIGYSRSIVNRILNELNIKISKNVKIALPKVEKFCNSCLSVKHIDNFYKKLAVNGIKYFSTYCIDCESIRAKIYRKNNLKNISLQEKRYRENNRSKINKNYNKYISTRKSIDPAFKLRRELSASVAVALKKNNASKKGSCLKFMEFTIKELKDHLEKQFQSWMTWENWGVYDSKTWEDNNPSTWTWQIDHIVPQSNLPYSSMNDDNFKICWSLRNLRPLNAKENILDGIQRTRH